MIMKSDYMNYFKDGKLYQWDEVSNVFTITPVSITSEFCLDKKSMDMFLKFNNPEIKLGKTLEVKSGNVKASIKLAETSLYVPSFEYTHTIKMNVDKLKTAIKYISTKDNSPALTGVNLGNGHVSASDRYSSYYSEIECADCNIVIAKQFIDAIKGASGEIELRCNNQMITTKIDDVVYIGRLIAAQFPPLGRIYQNIGSLECKVNKNELIQLLSYSADPTKDVAVFEKNRLIIKGTIEIDSYIDMNFECTIAIPVARINAILSSITDEELVINYREPKHPVFFNKEFLALPVVMGD